MQQTRHWGSAFGSFSLSGYRQRALIALLRIALSATICRWCRICSVSPTGD